MHNGHCRQAVIPLATGEGMGRSRKGRPPATPWARLLHHPAVWAIVVNNFTFHYAFYVVMNWLPTYFDKVIFPSISVIWNERSSVCGCLVCELLMHLFQV